MKENVIDILMYLFEHCMDYDQGAMPDEESLRDHLDNAGFQHNEIDKAFAWLEGLADARESAGQGDRAPSTQSLRILTADEQRKLDRECQGFLLFLEQSGILDPVSRELVFDRAMALDAREIDLNQIKWIVLMVLFNQPGQEAAYAWMEDLLFDDVSEHLH